jgi:hypothetical protein
VRGHQYPFAGERIESSVRVLGQLQTRPSQAANESRLQFLGPGMRSGRGRRSKRLFDISVVTSYGLVNCKRLHVPGKGCFL